MASFEVPGATLNIEVDGDDSADAVMLWNGAACTLRMWDAVAPGLAQTFRVVRFDPRGIGQSSPTEDPDRQYRFETYANDAAAILDHLGIERTHLWTMAWGSRAGLAFAALKPERVRRAAFFDASIGAADVKAQSEGHKTAMARQTAAGIQPFERPAGWNVHKFPDSVQPALGAARFFDLPAAAKTLRMPVLVATGDCDPNLPSSRELAATVANGRLQVMENVGHGSVLQRPDLTLEIALAFFQDQKNTE